MFGSTEVLEKARKLTNNARALEAVARLREIYEILKIYGYEKYVSFDFGMLSKYQYYTGIIFQAYILWNRRTYDQRWTLQRADEAFWKTCRIHWLCH